MKKKILLFISTIILMHSSFSQVYYGRAAEAIIPLASEVRIDPSLKTPLSISFKEGSKISGVSALSSLMDLIHMRTEDDFKLIKTEEDETGGIHKRLQQTYQGINVEHGIYILHEKNGKLIAANGNYFSDINTVINPVVTKVAALETAIKTIDAKKYIWENPGEEALLRSEKHDNLATWYPKGELVIFPGESRDKKDASRLCWKFDIYSTDPLGRYYIYVDAINNTIIYKENRICTVVATGTGNTKYNGTRVFITDSVSPGLFRLRDNSRSGGVETYNMLTGTSYGAAIDFTDADNIWTSTTNQDNAALDAHWGAQNTYDYYRNVHNRNSYDNLGSPMRSYVHYSVSYNNAYWDGTRMTYGDGDGSNFTALTELDVCGHELTHGVTQFSSGLIYSNESGALNESFSDIFGKTIDFYVNPSTADWNLGAKCYTPSVAGDALRYMNNPNAGGDPDTYHGTNWYYGAADNGGVHTNSGVQNFWYYLLVSGGSGINDIGFSFNVTGVGFDKARRIAYRTNSFYLTPASNYADAAYYSLKSAVDLFGNCSAEAIAVKNAWDAVGVVGLQLNMSAVASVSGTTCIGSSLQLNASGGVSYNWSGPNGYSSFQQNPVLTSTNAMNNGIYTCVISDGSGCSGSVSLNVLLNAPPNVNAGSDVNICNGIAASLNAVASVNGAGGNEISNSIPLALPDNPAPAVSSSIIISGAISTASLVSVTIDSITHTYIGDLDIRLVAPNGSEIILSSNNGSSGDAYLHTEFTPSAATSINAGTAPFTGTFAPEEPFSNLNGTANGTWKLKILDLGAQDIGTLWKWSLKFSPNTISDYSWTPTTGLSSSTVNNPSALPSSSTSYIIKVTDAIGCNAYDTVNVNVNSPLVLASVTNPNCGNNNGIIDITVNGLSGSNIYNWSNGATTQDISGLIAGTYTVTIANGFCTLTSNFTLVSQGAIIPSSPASINGLISACRNQNGIIYSIAPVNNATGYNWILPNGATGVSNSESISVSFGSSFSGGNICVSAFNNCGSSLPTCSTITQITAVPSVPVSISGLAVACANTVQTYSTATVPNASIYNWVIPANTTIVTGAGTNTIQLSFNGSWISGALQVSSGNCFGNSSARTLQIGSVLATPTTISGDRFAVCAGTLHPYSCTAVNGATGYVWTFPSGATITGQGTNNVQITYPLPFTSGTITVKAQNVCGVSAARTITPRSVPSTPGTISGPLNNNCGNSNATYSVVVSTTGATGYTWSVPAFAAITSGQNTNSIHVNFTGTGSGTITVHADNTCGSSANRSLSSVTTLPARPASITGPSTACINQSGLAFNVTSQTAVNYNWTLPSGATVLTGQTTAAITAVWGTVAGNVAVVASNNCGSALSRTKAITITCRTSFDESEGIQLYPNPAHNNVIISIEEASSRQYIYEIIDMLGRPIEEKVITATRTEISTENFARGVYMMQLRDQYGIVKTMRMVLQ